MTLPAFAGRVSYFRWHRFLYTPGMATKSSKSPSGEERDQKNEFIRKQEVEKEDVKGHPQASPDPRKARKHQENLSNRGYEEDQPHYPVRSSGSTRKDQETLPTGEPDKSDRIMKNNQTGPGLG